MSTPLHWELIAVLESGASIGRCGHRHRTKLAAVRCLWTPPDWDDYEICDLLVRQVRSDQRTQERLPLWRTA